MARIRTIKPEFCESETVGKLSRDARLLFIQLWTFVDDEGRARAASRMLASRLFPYDDDAPGLIDGWLAELERAGCIRRYQVAGDSYLDLPNWLKHQKIDHPSASKIPPFRETSRSLSNISETLAPDLGPGPRTKDQDQGSEPNGSGADAPASENSALPAKAPDAEVFRLGREVLGKSAGGVIAKLRKSLKYDDVRTLEVVREAAGKDRPMEWVQGVLRGDTTARTSEREYAEIYRGVQ